MGATQDAEWATLSPAEQLDRFPNVSDRKLYLLVYLALRQDFDYLWRSPSEAPPTGVGHKQLLALRDAVESLEELADRPSDGSPTEAFELWMRLKEAAVMAQEFELAAWSRDGQEGERRQRPSSRQTRLRTLFNYRFVPERDDRAKRTNLIREILGSGREPVPCATEWRTNTVLTLARQMYESREFSAMPILADALQDAGCDNDDILAHCRDTSQVHVRGCWVCDLVLGKT